MYTLVYLQLGQLYTVMEIQLKTRFNTQFYRVVSLPHYRTQLCKASCKHNCKLNCIEYCVNLYICDFTTRYCCVYTSVKSNVYTTV